MSDSFFSKLSGYEAQYSSGLKTHISKGAPHCDYMRWADRELRANTNCMSYALDLLDKGMALPGYLRMPSLQDIFNLKGSGLVAGKISLDFCKAGLEHDGLIEISANDYNPNDHIVALFFRNVPNDEDFHFLRLDEDGYWSDATIVKRLNEEKDIVIQKYEPAGVLGGVNKAFNFLTLKDNPLKKCPKGYVRYSKEYEQFGGFYKRPEELKYYPDSRLTDVSLSRSI